MSQESGQAAELVPGLNPEEEAEFEQLTAQIKEANAAGNMVGDELINRQNALGMKKQFGDPIPTAEEYAQQAANTQRLIEANRQPL